MQRALINLIIKDVNFTDSKTKTVPAKVALQLHAFKEDPPFNQSFDYLLCSWQVELFGPDHQA
jgi:hypothetical protein